MVFPEDLVRELNEAVDGGDVATITTRVKDALVRVACSEQFRLDPSLTTVKPACYARRLLHRDPERGYSAVVMTWGPGHGTQLHDHAGMWCVECVMQGEMDVTQFDLQDQRDGKYRFRRQQQIRACVGDAGCLIPPYEYHILANAHSDRKAVSLHVYGGEMTHCNLYVPTDGGWWECSPRQLGYDD